MKTLGGGTRGSNGPYLTQCLGELAAREVCGGSSVERNSITELIEVDVFLDIFSELHPETKDQRSTAQTKERKSRKQRE